MANIIQKAFNSLYQIRNIKREWGERSFAQTFVCSVSSSPLQLNKKDHLSSVLQVNKTFIQTILGADICSLQWGDLVDGLLPKKCSRHDMHGWLPWDTVHEK